MITPSSDNLEKVRKTRGASDHQEASEKIPRISRLL